MPPKRKPQVVKPPATALTATRATRSNVVKNNENRKPIATTGLKQVRRNETRSKRKREQDDESTDCDGHEDERSNTALKEVLPNTKKPRTTKKAAAAKLPTTDRELETDQDAGQPQGGDVNERKLKVQSRGREKHTATVQSNKETAKSEKDEGDNLVIFTSDEEGYEDTVSEEKETKTKKRGVKAAVPTISTDNRKKVIKPNRGMNRRVTAKELKQGRSNSEDELKGISSWDIMMEVEVPTGTADLSTRFSKRKRDQSPDTISATTTDNDTDSGDSEYSEPKTKKQKVGRGAATIKKTKTAPRAGAKASQLPKPKSKPKTLNGQRGGKQQPNHTSQATPAVQEVYSSASDDDTIYDEPDCFPDPADFAEEHPQPAVLKESNDPSPPRTPQQNYASSMLSEAPSVVKTPTKPGPSGERACLYGEPDIDDREPITVICSDYSSPTPEAYEEPVQISREATPPAQREAIKRVDAALLRKRKEVRPTLLKIARLFAAENYRGVVFEAYQIVDLGMLSLYKYLGHQPVDLPEIGFTDLADVLYHLAIAIREGGVPRLPKGVERAGMVQQLLVMRKSAFAAGFRQVDSVVKEYKYEDRDDAHKAKVEMLVERAIKVVTKPIREVTTGARQERILAESIGSAENTKVEHKRRIIREVGILKTGVSMGWKDYLAECKKHNQLIEEAEQELENALMASGASW